MRAPEVAAQASAGDGYAGLLVTTVVLLLAVCAVAFVVVRLLRRGLEGRAVGERLVTVVARVPLEPRRALYVIRVGGKTLLLGASDGGLTLLTELDGDAVPATTEVTAGRRFADLVAAAWTRRRGATPPGEGPV